MHEVLVNRLGGLSLPRKSVVRLTDHPDMTLDVYRGRKTTIQQQQLREQKNNPFSDIIAHSLKAHLWKMPHATRRISSACFDVYDAFTSAYTTFSVIHSFAVKSEEK